MEEILAKINPLEYIQPHDPVPIQALNVSRWFKVEVLELNFGDYVGRPQKDAIIRVQVLTYLFSNGWYVDAVVCGSEGGEWKSVGTSTNSNSGGTRTTTENRSRTNSNGSSTTKTIGTNDSSNRTVNKSESSSESRNNNTSNSETENHGSNSTHSNTTGSSSTNSKNDTKSQNRSSGNSRGNSKSQSSASSQSSATSSPWGLEDGRQAHSKGNSRSQSSGQSSSETSEETESSSETSTESSSSSSSETSSSSQTSSSSHTSSSSETSSSSKTHTSSETSSSSHSSSNSDSSTASNSNSSTQSSVRSETTNTGSGSATNESEGPYWFAYTRIRLKRRKMQSELVMQDMVNELTTAYNEGRKVNDDRYDEIVSLYSIMLGRTEDENNGFIVATADFKPLTDYVLSSMKKSVDDFHAIADSLPDEVFKNRIKEINLKFDNILSQSKTDLISKGLYNSTIMVTTIKGIERDREMAINDLLETKMDIYIKVSSTSADIGSRFVDTAAKMQQMFKDRLIGPTEMRNNVFKWMLDFMERRKDEYPGVDQIAGASKSLGYAETTTSNGVEMSKGE